MKNIEKTVIDIGFFFAKKMKNFIELMAAGIGTVYYSGDLGGGLYLSEKVRDYFNKSRKDKKAIIADYLPWLLIAIAILAILMITIFLLKSRGVSLIEQIKDLFKLG